VSVDVLRFEGLLQGEEVAYLGTEPERGARFAELPGDLDSRVRDAIGVPRLYAHQREVWDATERGEHVVVTTGTASGKTLAFNLPVLDALAREPKTRALYLYPTKALAQDQFKTLSGYRIPRLKPAIYDGDTPPEQRWQIRKWSNLILSNPDMVHVGLLPNHDRWGDVLSNLRYVIVDEAHVYRGVFGSHVANVLRRLRRLARIYGAEPQFIFATATISNPGELGSSLLGDRVTVVGDDAAPRAERTVVLWNPPLIDPEFALRASALAEASRLQAMFVERGLRTLTFAKSRKAAELIHRFTAERLGDDSRLSPYRAGYTAAQRREIERRLFEGDLLGDERARARHRRRPARRRHLRRLPRDGRLAPPAVGPRGPSRQRPRRARGKRGRPRPVLHARARQAPRAARRGGDPRPREPARAGRPRARGGLRGPAHG
jgi:DEAD/DEAH box helicase domain-containing protein